MWLSTISMVIKVRLLYIPSIKKMNYNMAATNASKCLAYFDPKKCLLKQRLENSHFLVDQLFSFAVHCWVPTIKSFTSEVTPLATHSPKRSYKISHSFEWMGCWRFRYWCQWLYPTTLQFHKYLFSPWKHEKREIHKVGYFSKIAELFSTPGPCLIRIHLVRNSTSARFEKNPKIFI